MTGHPAAPRSIPRTFGARGRLVGRLAAAAVALLVAAGTVGAPIAAATGLDAVGRTSAAAGAQQRIVLTLAPGQSPSAVARDLVRQGMTITSRIDGIGTLVVDAAPAAGGGTTLARLSADPRFTSAEPPVPMWADAASNDPLLAAAWWLDSIDVKPAWSWPRPSAPVVIATVDTGVDFKNPDLSAVVLPGRNFVTPGDQAQDDSTNGHGTHVAGIAVAVDDGIGNGGASSWTRILPVKVLDATGEGDSSRVAEGIVWAVDQGARVVNLSLDGAATDPCPAELIRAVDYARSRNAIVVSASGNLGSAVGCPGRIPGVLSVGAVDGSLNVWSGSNRGPQLSLVAPGVGITSTVPVGMGTFGTLTGTSMAAPMVSGAAAIIAGAAPSLAEDAIRSALIATAKDIGLPGRDDTYGSGLLDVNAALAATAEPITDVVAAPTMVAADGSGADQASLAFHVAVPATATVAVESADGKVVRTLSTDPLTVGDEHFTWDITDETGTRVPDGAYRFAIRGTAPGGIAIAITRPIAVSLALTSARLSVPAVSPNGDGKNDSTVITYALRAPATVRVTVRDAAGRTVRTLASSARPTGSTTVTWNGRTGAGASSPIPPDGTYTIAIAATTARGTYELALPVVVSIHGVAVTGLKATSVYPVADGYRDSSAITFTQAGPASATLVVYPAASATPLRTIALGALKRGAATAAWDGRDSAGRVVRAGTYRVRILTTDAAKVARWSGFSPVTVSAKRLVQRVFTTTLRGDQHDPRTFVSSPDTASVGASTLVSGGVRIQASGPDDRASAFWVVSLPAWTTIVAAKVGVDSIRSANGSSVIGTWNGTTVDTIGFIQGTGGGVEFPLPVSRLVAGRRSVALAVSQEGPGSVDVASVRLAITYTVLQ